MRAGLEREVQISPDVHIAIVAAPSYLADHPAPQSPQGLIAYRCIQTRMPTHGNILKWVLEKEGEKARVRVEWSLVVSTLGPCINAALDGLAFVPEDRAPAQIANGRLVPLLPDWWPSHEGYHFYYPSRRQPTPAFRLLLDALRPRR